MNGTTIRHGLTNQVTSEFAPGFTVGQLLRDRNILRRLNAPEGVVARANGRVLEQDDEVCRYSEINLEAQASGKQ